MGRAIWRFISLLTWLGFESELIGLDILVCSGLILWHCPNFLSFDFAVAVHIELYTAGAVYGQEEKTVVRIPALDGARLRSVESQIMRPTVVGHAAEHAGLCRQ